MKVQHAYPIELLETCIRQLNRHIRFAFDDIVMSALPQ